MKKLVSIGLVCAVLLAMTSCDENDCPSCPNPRGPVIYTGWATGWYVDENLNPTKAAIVHTKDSGHTWVEQGDPSQWAGHVGNDISAVDEQTAWAAFAQDNLSDGMILHTIDGGKTWVKQTIPAEVHNDGIKGVKGLSRNEAWAVSLKGIVLHTTDGGNNWSIVPTGIATGEINRIDAIGQNIWIVDHLGGANGIIHTKDGGLTWRQETLPDVNPGSGPLVISAFSPSVVWSAVNLETDLFRTLDGGNSWRKEAEGLSGMNDFDDICAGSPDWVWAVLNQGGFLPGTIFRVGVAGPAPVVQKFDPAFLNYQYEGVTCFDENKAWVVGYASMHAIPELPQGLIMHTDDGHNWENQTMPANNIRLWKVSFVGARR